MDIPKTIINRNRRYKFIKEYPNFILYQDVETGVREAFKRSDLGMVEHTIKTHSAHHKKNQW